MDFGKASAKLKAEQEKRRREAKMKMEREKALRVQAERNNLKLESMVLEKQQLKIQEEQRKQQLELQRAIKSGGIVYDQVLHMVPIDNKGDRITLPVNALETLNPQDALKSSPLTFELNVDGFDIKTHCGVLEFTADENTIGVPPNVYRSLVAKSTHTTNWNKLHVQYVQLPKGRFVQLQPIGNGLGDRKLDIKHLLEQMLKQHVTLTLGDIVLLRHGNTTFEMRVLKLLPQDQVLESIP